MALLDRLFGRTQSLTTSTAPTASSGLPKAPRAHGSIAWIPAGEPVNVSGQTIPGGMLYVGSGAAAGNGYSIEPALIDAGLAVSWTRPDRAGASMGYWPSYADITPGARAAYLQWLMEGRSDPGACIGYVFLFFYGLERRLLVDLKVRSEHPETRLIADEVRRLLAIYSNNRSFEGYASALLDLIETTTAPKAAMAPPDWTGTAHRWEVPATVRVGLGHYLAAGEPIPAQWALALLRVHPESYLRTPATRCESEFDDLFRQRYRRQFGDGLVVVPPKACIELEYRPASGGLIGVYRHRFEDLPDICATTTVINKLKELAADCTDSLDAYSRYLGRNPDAAGEPTAVGQLPDELVSSHGGPVLEGLRDWARAIVATGARAGPVNDVIAYWSPGRTTKLTKKDAVSLASLLSKLGVGIEPDVRFGGKTPAPGSKVVLFPLAQNAPTAPSPRYAAAAVLVHLTAVVASADGSIDNDERRHLAEHLEASLGLDPDECARLEAHLAWLTADKPSLAGIKRRLDALDNAHRGEIGRFLVELAAADGVVSPEEITTLAKLYKLLGLDEGDVYSAVHALGIDTGTVAVWTAEPDTRHTIPEPDAIPQPVRLDASKVQERLAETAAVTALLADIFSEDDEDTIAPESSAGAPASPPATGPTSPTATSTEVRIDGLDAAHTALADRLRAKGTWDRTEVEQLASSLGLPLLDGALDCINEIAMNACEEPLIEGDDPLEINDYAVEELFS